MSTTTTTTATSGSYSLQSPSIPTGPVEADIVYTVGPSDGSPPYNWVEKQPEGIPQNNLELESKKATILDMRGRENEFELDTQAFAVTNSTSDGSIDWANEESVQEKYYPEVTSLLKKVTGGHTVTIFDHTIRRNHPNSNRTPVLRAHIDQTATAARTRVELHNPDNAAELLQGRVRLINVWRPLNGPVESHPLAVADSRTLPAEKLLEVEHRYPNRTGYTAAIAYTPELQWYYLSGMTNEERLLLQCYDSKTGTRVPHTAFVDPRTPEGAKERESIEVRALVYG